MCAYLQGTICSISVSNLQRATEQKNNQQLGEEKLSFHNKSCQRSFLINIYHLLTSKRYSHLHSFHNWTNASLLTHNCLTILQCFPLWLLLLLHFHRTISYFPVIISQLLSTLVIFIYLSPWFCKLFLHSWRAV